MDERVSTDVDSDTLRRGDILSLGQAFFDLLDNPIVLPYLEELLGDDLRLDHVYIDIIRWGLSPIGANLHGGGTPFNSTQFYHHQNGQMECGLSVAAFNLRDVGPEDGGFACVPGSHKGNYAIPSQWRDLSRSLQSIVSKVTGPAGSVVIFTEALTHGPLPWTDEGEHRTVFSTPHARSPGRHSIRMRSTTRA